MGGRESFLFPPGDVSAWGGGGLGRAIWMEYGFWFHGMGLM